MMNQEDMGEMKLLNRFLDGLSDEILHWVRGTTTLVIERNKNPKMR